MGLSEAEQRFARIIRLQTEVIDGLYLELVRCADVEDAEVLSYLDKIRKICRLRRELGI